MIQIRTNFYRSVPARIKELIGNLNLIQQLDANSSLEIRSKFVTPLSITPIAYLVHQNHIKCSSGNEYLETIRFPHGVDLEEAENYHGTYTPIVRLELGQLGSQERSGRLEVLHDRYTELIENNIVGDPDFLRLITKTTFGFVLSEMCDNISEHSEANSVFLFAQYWPRIESCEVCLLDNGCGLYKSLANAGREVQDSDDAMLKVINEGWSAKYDEGINARGTGIRNTISVLTNDIVKGEFSILSGSSLYCCSHTRGSQFFRLQEYDWNGTIVTMRFNKPASRMNIYDYIR